MRRFIKHATIVAGVLGAASLAFAHGDHEHFGAGEPGVEKAVSKTIEVVMTDADGKMALTPARVEVKRGETIKFVVRNAGMTTHEFVIGDKAENAAHAKMMADMPDMRHNDPSAKTIDPDKTATLTWRFTKKGEFEFDCLLPGHYEAGMHGVVVVK